MNDRPKLVILDGQIFVEKTPNLFESPKDYLTNWQSEKKHPNGTQVRVLTEDLFQDLIAQAVDCASDLLASVTEQRDEARRLAEKYRNLSCDSQDEADETLLPWETTNPNEL
jgi:hypothetical protein